MQSLSDDSMMIRRETDPDTLAAMHYALQETTPETVNNLTPLMHIN